MSYILDALKKAEAERKLGSIPTLNASPVTMVSFDDNSHPVWKRPLIASMLTGLAIAALVLMWFNPWQGKASPSAENNSSVALALPKNVDPSTGETSAPPFSATSNHLSSATSPPAAVTVPPVQSTPPATVAANEPSRRQTSAQDDSLSQKIPVLKSARQEDADKPVKKPKEGRQALPAQSDAPVLAAKNPAAISATSTMVETHAGILRDLPENIQREIPPLTVSGYIYSNNQAERSVLINRKLLREGDEVAPGIVLEKMLPKEAVLNYKGYRYRISY